MKYVVMPHGRYQLLEAQALEKQLEFLRVLKRVAPEAEFHDDEVSNITEEQLQQAMREAGWP